MSEMDLFQILGDFWPRLHAQMSNDAKRKMWLAAFENYDAAAVRDSARVWAESNASKTPSVNDLRRTLTPTKKAGASPELRERTCPTCTTRLREWYHADADGGPKWRILGDGGLLFQQRPDGWYAVRCPTCTGPTSYRATLPVAKDPTAWMPLARTPLQALMPEVYDGKTQTMLKVSAAIGRAADRTRKAFVAQEKGRVA